MLTRATAALPPETETLMQQAIGCAIQVHRTLGPGYLEMVYHDALAIELEVSGLPFERGTFVPIKYRERVIRGHRLDLVIGGQVVVELKAVERLESIHTSQVVAYLRASGLRAGLLINFNVDVLKAGLRRVVL